MSQKVTDQELLKTIMLDTKYNQAQIAKIIGTTRQYIGLVYNGKNTLSLRLRNKLKEHFPNYFSSVSLPKVIDNKSIKEFRIANHYSQTKFASLLEIAQPTLSQIESGEIEVSQLIKDNFKRAFAKETTSLTIYYCPEVTIPYSFTLPKHPEVISIDKRLLNFEKGLATDNSQMYLVTISGDTLSPVYENNDRVIIDTSHKTFKDGHIYLIKKDDNYYIRKVNVLPDKIKCIPFNDKQDAFYLRVGEYQIIGLIIPRIRL